jgi:hypothetical protein
MNLFRHDHANIMLSQIFKFCSALCKGGKKTHRHFKYLYQAKILAPADFNADIEIARQIQTVIPANR